MNLTEFVFAVIAVSSATAIIYGWYAWVYSLDDGYQETRKRNKAQQVQAKSAANK